MVTTVTNLAGWPGSEPRNDSGKEAVLEAARRLLTPHQLITSAIPGSRTICDTLSAIQEREERMNAAPTANRVANVDLEYIFSYWATLASPEVVGPIAEGIRVNFYVTAGEVSGPKMRGRLRTVGGDWLLLRTDGVGVLDVRATLELDNGALIYTTYGGVVDLGPDGYNLFLKGILPPRPDLRIVPRYHTSHPEYLWLNRLQCVGVGVFDVAQSRVSYDIYAMR